MRKAAVAICYDGELKSSTSITLKKGDRQEELAFLAEWVSSRLIMCDYIVIEEPLIGRGVRASLQIALTAGAVMSAVHPIKSSFVPVKTWKKEVIGNGNADKEAVRMWLHNADGGYALVCGDDQDRIDASCIALYGAGLLDRASSLDQL